MATSAKDIAAALRYSPQTQQRIRRSEYLTDALQQMQQAGQEPIRSWGELGSKLLATAILSRSARKAKDEALSAYRSDMDAETESLIAALRGARAPSMGAQTPAPAQPNAGGPMPGGAAIDPAAVAPTVQAAPQPPPVQQAPLPPVQPQPAAAQIDPEVDAIVRTVWGEARGEDPTGQAAVAGVILNRARERGMKPRDVVFQKGQFEPWANPETRARMEALTPDSPEYQAILQNIAPALQGQNPVGGADHFYSPGAQAALGRQPPAWDNGAGQDLGRHRFFDLEQPQQGAQDVQFTSGPAPAQPFQVAAAGPLQPGMIPSAPGSSPSAGGTPPAAPFPQASAAGGTPLGPVTYQPTEQEIALVERLLRDPRTHEQGRVEWMKLQQKMAQPIEWDVKVQDGFQIATDPRNPANRVVTPISELQYRQATAQQLNIPAPAGTTYAVSPQGRPEQVYAPPQGYQSGPAGQQSINPGGPAAVEVERQLRTDFEKAPEYRSFGRAAAIYDSLKRDFSTPGRVSDINFVYGIATIFDPDSVVREAEQVVIRNSQSLPDWLVGEINRINGGQGLQPAIRAQMLETAGTRLQAMQQQLQARQEFTEGIAQRYGIDPRNVIPPLPEFAPWQRPEAMRVGAGARQQAQYPQAVVQAHQLMRQRGDYNPNAALGSQSRPFLATDEASVRAVDRPENKGKYIILPNGDLAVIE